MMIRLDGAKVALIAAAVARVAESGAHKFVIDEHLRAISSAVGAEGVSVYDLGKRDEKTRFIRFDFPQGEQIEIEVGPQPEMQKDTRPEGDDDTPGGTPVAMRMAA
ncbi:hypothetical protein [Xanthomonas phage BUDD]|nr:hypothetical protein [Xanthomonas phage BUDD]